MRVLTALDYIRCKGDPCCYVKDKEGRFVTYLSWVDNCLFLGTEDDVVESKTDLMKYFGCNDIGFLDEYVGCRIEMRRGDKSVKFTQPVLIRNLVEDFKSGNKKVSSSAVPGQTLQAGNIDRHLKCE